MILTENELCTSHTNTNRALAGDLLHVRTGLNTRGNVTSRAEREVSNIIGYIIPQNTSVPQNTGRIYFQYKIWKKRAKYFILVNIY